ncbi:methionyl-tRNA formyltransferase [Salinicoccus roseus]|uniref:methionyl-tRNA formyltransferase n=1 Tax=Salinicoccus roseus TaxID=45670 RepID=UPI002300535E|nr:methionyl-tRNA formyltransferase [Salinicoccus roseus]
MDKIKTILIGSVGSSELVLEEMIKNHFFPELVFSLDEAYAKKVSSFVSLTEKAEEHKIPYRKFKNINDKENVELIAAIQPDYIFVIGLSQLVKKDIINLAKEGVIGYHPTALPEYRGRAAIPWQIVLGVRHSKCSLFFIDEGMDSGDIIGQEDFIINEDDYANDVITSSRQALRKLLKKTILNIKTGKINAKSQNEEDATYLLKRSPEDGRINWHDSLDNIHKLIRASSRPFPGAFTYYNGKSKFIIWKAEKVENNKYIGFPGQIARYTNDYIDVICSDGILRVFEYDKGDIIKITIGNKFI